MPLDGSLMPRDIIPVTVSVSLSSLQEASSFSLFTNCLWIFISKYSMTVCMEYWELFKIPARLFLKRICTLRYDWVQGVRKYFSVFCFPSLWITILSVFAYNFLQSCIQFTGKKKNYAKLVNLKWTTWSCSFLPRHLGFFLHWISFILLWWAVLVMWRVCCNIKLFWRQMEKPRRVGESWVNIIWEQPFCWPPWWWSHPHNLNCRQNSWAGAMCCSTSCTNEKGLS